MFRRELELARHQGECFLQKLDLAVGAVAELQDVVKFAREALDAGWRMESALGEFLAIDDEKARVTGFLESKTPAAQAFALVKDGLKEGAVAIRKSEAELLEYLHRLKDQATEALARVDDALSKAPPAEAWRYRGAGREPREAQRATVVIKRDPEHAHSFDGVRRLVESALEPIGGMGAFVKRGQTVLIKPNLTLFFLAEEGVTTDPRIVAALVRLAKEAGAARVMVGESSGGGTSTTEAMDITGIANAAKREGAELVDFHTSVQRETEINGKIIKRILLPAPLLDADVIINTPKAKTHHMDLISGAIKAWVGILRPDVRSEHHDWNTYQDYVDIMSAVRPTLNVVDAIFIGEGNGPGATTGRFYGGVVASTDPVATDATVARLMGLNPEQIAFVQLARENGIGVAGRGQIDVVGVPLEEAEIRVKAPQVGVDYYDANIIVGAGISRPGTLGHFKSSADIWLKMGVWKSIVAVKGKPTIMIGDAEDPLFERHLSEGPYVVIDDAAQAKYKQHPKVTFIPGHPALHNILPQLMEGLGVPGLGQMSFEWMKVLRNVESSLQYSQTPAASLAAIPATLRRLPIGTQYATLGLLTAGLALGLAWASIGAIGAFLKKPSKRS